MSRLRLADYAQRGVTLCLFGITTYGAVVVGDGAFDIINRRIKAGPAVTAPSSPSSGADVKIDSKKT